MNMSNVQFTSLNVGTLALDARVNYEFGLVLGVNEFRQEQKYFLDKNYLHNSELHGYGTITGLEVTTELYPSGDHPTDVQVTVKSGMAIDQLGRTLVVREDQCARLGDWLAQQVRDDPDTLNKHKGNEDGFRTLYIVASYAEAEDQKVPVARGMTSNNGSTYSRIRDYFTIEFRWDKPQMPAWDAVRAFSRLLSKLHIAPHIPGAAGDDDEDGVEDLIEDICERVRKIGQPPASDTKQKKHERRKRSVEEDEDEDEKEWYIPEYAAQRVFDSIFTVWITEVRSRLVPNLIENIGISGDQESGILLTRIDFKPDNPFQVDKPVIIDFDVPSNKGRPFLLSTQVLQELVAEGGRDAQPPREFATLHTVDSRTLQVWIHHPQSITFADDIDDWDDVFKLKCDGQSLSIAGVTPLISAELSNAFEIRVNADEDNPDSMMLPGSRIELTFHLNERLFIELNDEDEDEGRRRRRRRAKKEDEGLVGSVEDTAEGIEQGTKKTLKGHPIKGAERVAEGAFHAVEDIAEGAFHGVEDVAKGALHTVEDVAEGAAKGAKDVLKGKPGEGAEDVVKGVAEGAKDAVEGAVRGVEDVLGVPGKDDDDEDEEVYTLNESIGDLGIDYIGYDRAANTITVYTIATHWPTRELATLYLFNPQVAQRSPEHPASMLAQAAGGESALHLWFHTEKPVKLPQTCRVQVPLSFNSPPREASFGAYPPPGLTYSYFWALVPPAELALQPGELLSVLLDTDSIMVEGENESNGVTPTSPSEKAEGGDGGAGEPGDKDVTSTRLPVPDVTDSKAADTGTDPTNAGGGSRDATDEKAADTGADPTDTGSNSQDVTDTGDGEGDEDEMTLSEAIRGLPYRLLGWDGDHSVSIHHQVPQATQTIVEEGEGKEQRRRAAEPYVPFVTITHLAEREREGDEEKKTPYEESFELWFHLIPDPADEIASMHKDLTCEVSAEFSDLRRSSRADVTSATATQLNVFIVNVTLPQPPANQRTYYLRFRFSLAGNQVRTRNEQQFESLKEYIERRGLQFEGFNGRDAIIAYARIPIRKAE